MFAEAGRSHQYCGKACRDQADGVVVPAQRTVPLDERGPHALLPHEIRFYEKGDDFYEFTNFWECDKLVIDGQRWSNAATWPRHASASRWSGTLPWQSTCSATVTH